MDELKSRNFASPERMKHLCNRALDVIATLVSCDGTDSTNELYSWLSEKVGMTDVEIMQAGFDCVPEKDVVNNMKSITEHLIKLANNLKSYGQAKSDKEYRENLLALNMAIALIKNPKKVRTGTVFGTLSAELSGDQNYPGIVICIEQDDKFGKYTRQLALVECTIDMPKEGNHALRLLVWKNDNDDYTDGFTFIEKSPED